MIKNISLGFYFLDLLLVLLYIICLILDKLVNVRWFIYKIGIIKVSYFIGLLWVNFFKYLEYMVNVCYGFN